MEINLKKLSDQAVESTVGTKKMRLSDNATSMVFQLFTKNVYSNPIGTVVREITSNCYDSHTEAGVQAPVLIRKSIDGQTNTINISFIDYGVGMSPDRVENIYGVYFESTKRVDNTQIGGFGIGGKTPLAYKRSTGAGEGEYDNSFYVITTYNGTKYYYCIYEGAESPVISLLHQEETTDRNGTEVRIPVLQKDLSTFKKEMVRQLYYFENVIFEGFEDGGSTEEILNNEYQIVRGKNFLYRGEDYDTNVHVCLGRVAYPLDYNVLGLEESDYDFPVAIRMEVGEIGVTVSRETLDYSESTIKILKKKLEAVKKELGDMLAKQYENIVTLEDYFLVKNKFGEVRMPNGKSFQIGDSIKLKDVDFSNFKYSFMKMPNDKQLFRFFFESKFYGKKESRYRRYRYNNNDNSESCFEGGYDELVDSKALYYFTGEFQRKIVKQAWLKSIHERYYMISKKNMATSYIMKDVADLFNVHDSIMVTDDKGNIEPTAYCKSLMELQDEFFELVLKYCKDYDKIEVPEDFIESRKREKISAEMRNTTIPIKIFGSYSRYRVKLDSLFNLSCPIYYGTKNDEGALSQAERMFEMLFNADYVIKGYNEHNNNFRKGKQSIMFIMVAENNVKYMEFCKKAIHISKFRSTMMRRKEDKVLEYFQSVNFVERYQRLNELYRHNDFKKLSPVWGKKIAKINTFISTLTAGSQNNWSRYRLELASFFPINTVKNTKEQETFISTIDELEEMQTLNSETIVHINMPYRIASANDNFWNILKKVLVY